MAPPSSPLIAISEKFNSLKYLVTCSCAILSKAFGVEHKILISVLSEKDTASEIFKIGWTTENFYKSGNAPDGRD